MFAICITKLHAFSSKFVKRFEKITIPKFRATSILTEIRRERNSTFRQNLNSDTKTKLSICSKKLSQRTKTTSKLNSAFKISPKTFFSRH